MAKLKENKLKEKDRKKKAEQDHIERMRLIKKQKEDQEMNKAATKIGAAYRGRKARKEVAKLKAEKKAKAKVPRVDKDVSIETPSGPDPQMPAIIDAPANEPVKDKPNKNVQVHKNIRVKEKASTSVPETVAILQ